MFIVKASKWTHDGKFNITKKSTQHMYEFRGEALKEAMSNYHDAANNNDLTKYTTLDIYNVINTDEE
jgi:hypothetical protein